MQLNGAAGGNYLLQTSSNLTEWIDFTNLYLGSNGALNYIDAATTNYPRRFYRLKNP